MRKSNNFNLSELRYKTDTQYFYFLIKLKSMDYPNNVNISILFDTCGLNTGYDTINEFGIIKGSLMTIARIVRCHPWSKGGYDPIKK